MWPEETIDTVDDFSAWLVKAFACKGLIFRGVNENRSDWKLTPSICRPPIQPTYLKRLQEEREVIDEFEKTAHRFLGRLEQHYVSNFHPLDRVIRMTVLQHFGAPTRLLDWAHSPTVAAYFACIDGDGSDGLVWWFDRSEHEKVVNQMWESAGFTRLLHGGIDYNERIFDTDVPPIVGTLHLTIPFPRADAQHSLFSICTRLDSNHDEILCRLLPAGTYGKKIIRHGVKRELVSILDRLGINAVSIHHAGADRCGLEMYRNRSTQSLGHIV